MNSLATIDTTDAIAIEDAARRRDPCECNDLRSRLSTSMRQVVNALKNSIRLAINDNDMLGLNGLHPLSWQQGTRIAAFNAYVDVAMKRMIEMATGSTVSSLRSSYDRGLKKARGELDVQRGLPGHYVIDDLHMTAVNDIEAIAQATKAALIKQAQLAIAAKETASQAYRRMSIYAIKRIASTRLDVMAATIITTGYNNGKLDIYENAGLDSVHVIAESFPHRHHDHDTIEIRDGRKKKLLRTPTGRIRAFLPKSRAQLVTLLTAGDDRVCDICDDLEGTTYTVTYARRLIPVHPRCRCVVVPVGDKRFKPVPFTRKDDVVKRRRAA